MFLTPGLCRRSVIIILSSVEVLFKDKIDRSKELLGYDWGDVAMVTLGSGVTLSSP